MKSHRPYVRAHYRLPISYPAMFSDTGTIGEARVSNLSVSGCTLDCEETMPELATLDLRLILPDDRESLPIDGVQVRWVQGTQLGLQFRELERKANLRLHGFVWDRMLERIDAQADGHHTARQVLPSQRRSFAHG
jgi:hypothetical protein